MTKPHIEREIRNAFKNRKKEDPDPCNHMASATSGLYLLFSVNKITANTALRLYEEFLEELNIKEIYGSKDWHIILDLDS